MAYLLGANLRKILISPPLKTIAKIVELSFESFSNRRLKSKQKRKEFSKTVLLTPRRFLIFS